jgi:hypothetical protein
MSMMGKIHQLKSYYIHTLLYEEETWPGPRQIPVDIKQQKWNL